MKTIRFMAAALCAATALGFTSCSDDDNNDGPVVPDVPGSAIETIFPEGLPASVDGMNITKNAAGQVTKIVDNRETYTFEYGTFNRAEYQVKMTCVDSEYPDDGYTIYMQLDGNGRVSNALQVYNDGDEDTWAFTYNADGRLTSLKRSEGGDEGGFEISELTYTSGDATSVKTYEVDAQGQVKPDNTDVYTILYAKTGVNAIANKGALMLFDVTLSVDLDEMDKAYYAGLLGKSTVNLPIESRCQGASDYETFDWTLNAKGLPTKMVATDHSEYGNYEDTYTFAW